MLATIDLGDVFLSVLWFCGLFLWISLAVTVFFDLFRSPDVSGWGKALWVVFIIILPLLGVLVYLIVRGGSMHERAVSQAKSDEAAFRSYVQQAASTPADDLHKLADLKERGLLTDEEYQRAKAKAIGS
jgi:hypothetical protein